MLQNTRSTCVQFPSLREFRLYFRGDNISGLIRFLYRLRRFMESMEQFGIWIVMILVVVGGGFFGAIMTGAMQGILNFFYWIVGA